MSPKKINIPRLQGLMTRFKPVAARMKPFARKTGKIAKERVHRGRVWAAPRVARSGHVIEESVAPKVSHLLSSAAHLIEPKENGAASAGAAPADGQTMSEETASR